MAEYDPSKHCGAQRPNQPAGVLCTRPKGWGTSHPGYGSCKRHGGSTAAGTASAQREMLAEVAGVLGVPLDVDPHTALLDEVRRTAGHVAALQLIVAGLERPDVVRGTTQEVELPDGSSRVTVAAALNVWVDLYQRERRHLVLASQTAIRCGVEERRVELEERHGELLADVIRHVIEDSEVGLSPAQQHTALVVSARHLRVIQGGRAA